MSTGVFRLEQSGPTLVVEPTCDLGELDFVRIEKGAVQVFAALESGQTKNVILDLQQTNYCGSTALSFFLKVWKRVKTDGGRMIFCGLSPTEEEVFSVTNLDTLFPIKPDRAAALEALGGDD